jgi:hypothetical protein
LAVVNYHEANRHYPPAYQADAEGRPMHSWRVLILPYLEQDAVYRRYLFSEPWDGPNNRQLELPTPGSYVFHGEKRTESTTTNYLAIVGPETVWPGRSTITSDAVKDGKEGTILVVENRGAGIHWMEPRDLSFADMDFTFNSPRGLSSKYRDPAVATLDGRVYRLRKELSAETLRALLTIRGSERVGPDGEGGWEFLPDGRLREPAEP